MERSFYRFPDGCAVTEYGRLVEYLDLREESQYGDIVLAKADRMMRGMECAFVNIGRKKDGFLPLKENSRSFTDGEIHSGDLIAVQIKREETGDKGAFLTRDLTIPGKMIILMPKNRYIGVSGRIQDEKTRERLRETGKRIAGGDWGLVMRAASEKAPENEIRLEFAELLNRWKDTINRLRCAQKPGEVLFSPDPANQMITDYGIAEAETVYLPELPAGLKSQLSAAGNRKVKLSGGGNIIIDRCEAMTVIDVNTASAVYSGEKETTVTAANLEACDEVAVQVRLRDIAGMILIDFIDMDRETDRSLVEQKLKESFSRDRRKTVIHGWTRLGIMEMTRKRV